MSRGAGNHDQAHPDSESGPVGPVLGDHSHRPCTLEDPPEFAGFAMEYWDPLSVLHVLNAK